MQFYCKRATFLTKWRKKVFHFAMLKSFWKERSHKGRSQRCKAKIRQKIMTNIKMTFKLYNNKRILQSFKRPKLIKSNKNRSIWLQNLHWIWSEEKTKLEIIHMRKACHLLKYQLKIKINPTKTPFLVSKMILNKVIKWIRLWPLIKEGHLRTN